ISGPWIFRAETATPFFISWHLCWALPFHVFLSSKRYGRKRSDPTRRHLTYSQNWWTTYVLSRAVATHTTNPFYSGSQGGRDCSKPRSRLCGCRVWLSCRRVQNLTSPWLWRRGP